MIDYENSDHPLYLVISFTELGDSVESICFFYTSDDITSLDGSHQCDTMHVVCH